MVAPDPVIDDAAGAAMIGGVRSFATMTVTAGDVAVLPAPSRAVAVSVWLPFATVFVSQDTEYGAPVTSAPKVAPSSLNCTPAMETLSVALAVTVMVPATLAFGAGVLIATDGGAASGIVNVKSIEV